MIFRLGFVQGEPNKKPGDGKPPSTLPSDVMIGALIFQG